ncbi:ATP-binding cassette domain-containing protein [Mycobacterium yunnanensis]|uniref:ATP-binding cassette domain-containing protein n=1 Tax=Mycobacterium yunnanensis TaxID=368477 RepID=A0A9X2Z8Z9_9MYCO|nr:ATP-binding cassette domain-containing protein [Mycobacterium yunnanensis]MCV7424065.1 ATP-binding cassette domain-containing protein [Mycobacterium yunnanensis]
MLELIDVTKTYRTKGRAITALDGLTLRVPDKAIFGIAGRSGAGKSTLIRVVNALERPDGGKVLLDGEDLLRLPFKQLRDRRRKIGMIFQHFNLLHSQTVRENIEFPLTIAGIPKAQRKSRVDELVELVGLGDRVKNYPSQLSGGQKQRVGIARALAAKPSVLLSDEATSALDSETTNQILALLTSINHELGLTIVLITHELELLRRSATHVAVLRNGRLVEQGQVLDLVADPESRLGRDLLPGLTDAPVAPGKVKVLITAVGPDRDDAMLADIALDTGSRFDVVSGGVYEVSNHAVARFELAVDDTSQVRRTLGALAERKSIRVDFAHE